MKNLLIFFYFVITLLLLGGCVSNPTSPSTSDPEILALEAQVKENNEPYLIGELADAYLKDYEKNKNPESRRQAIKYYKQFQEFSPEHVGVQVAIYSLMSEEIYNQKKTDPASYAELEKKFQDSEIIRRNNLASPSLLKALWLLKNGRTDNDLKTVMSYLKDSVKEYPDNPAPYILMSELQSHLGQERLALATLRQAVRVSPDNVVANKALGNKILGDAYAQHCVTQSQAQLNEAVKAIKKVIKQTPNDFESHESLMELFGLLGKTKLRLHEANLIHKSKNDRGSKYDLAFSLISDQQPKKSEPLYLELLEKKPNGIPVLNELAQMYTNTGQWDKADTFWKRFLQNEKKPTIYHYLYL
ncbi:MAG: hypothetical protein AB8D52_03430 [Gammaproteobacteria bacterium]